MEETKTTEGTVFFPEGAIIATVTLKTYHYCTVQHAFDTETG